MIRRFTAEALALVLLSTCAGGEPAYAQTAFSLAVMDATGTTRTLCETLAARATCRTACPLGLLWPQAWRWSPRTPSR